MNRPLSLLLLLLALAAAPSLRAQDTTAAGSDTTAPPGSTVITSDELRSDETTHTSVFTGNVTVAGTNFNMTCEEMTVIFQDGKVDHITAKGNVVIVQPGRITHSGQAEYFKDEDKFVLTDQPNILDNKNQIAAPVITIFRTDQRLITSGGRSTVTLAPGTATPTSSSTPPLPSSNQ